MAWYEDIQTIRAAGGVLWRQTYGVTLEVALVHQPRYRDWSLPKGKPRRGEHPLAAARREVAEETGIRAVAGKRLELGHYDTPAGPEAVEYWAMRGPDAPFTPTAEMDGLAWMSMADARSQLGYRGDSYAIDASTLLSACGAQFAQTMQPLGSVLGLDVYDEPALGEEAYARHPGRGQSRVNQLASTDGGPAAVCASGMVIRHLLAALAKDAELGRGSSRPATEAPTRCSSPAGSSPRLTTTRPSSVRGHEAGAGERARRGQEADSDAARQVGLAGRAAGGVCEFSANAGICSPIQSAIVHTTVSGATKARNNPAGASLRQSPRTGQAAVGG
jgi:hypothetical protein